MTNPTPHLLELNSARLHFREFVADDWLSIYRWSHDTEQTRYDSTPDLSTARARNIVNMIVGYQHEEPRQHFYFIIQRHNDPLAIGSIYASIRDEVNRSVEIGYRISTSEWGKGYATEAATLLRDFALHELRAQRVFAQVVTANIGSVRVLEKIGMVREQVFHRTMMRRGNWYDTAVYVYWE